MAIRSDDNGTNEPKNQQQEEQVEEQEDGIFIPTYINLHIYYLQKKASSAILGQMKY